MTDESPLLFRVEEAARMLGVSRATLYKLIDAEDLPTVRFGKSVRVPRKALEEWVIEKVKQENKNAK